MSERTIYREELPEHVVEGMRLGRHVKHDSLSWRFPAPMSDTIQSVQHQYNSLPLDQGNLGSCTGNAMVGLLMTEPFYIPGRDFNEQTAVEAYSWSTHHDRYRGVYPPTDTGCDGLTVCKWAIHQGYARGYGWSFGLEHALRTMTILPTITGAPWLSGMDSPDKDGIVHVTGSVRGGHEFLQVGLIINDTKNILTSEDNFVECMQSWGDWGLDGSGKFLIPVPEYGDLLKRRADVKTLVRA